MEDQGRLALTRRPGERIRLELGDGREVWITVLEKKGANVRLAFEAPASVSIMREELLEAGSA